MPLSGHAQETASDLSSYEVSVGDELLIDFLDDREGPFELSVGNDGAVQLPYLGTFALVGKPLSEAREVIAAAYVDGDIFVAPRLEISVVSLRPISVVGDVQTPGLYEHHADMTVEVAVGLAGGPVRQSGGEEARATQRIALRAELARLDAALLREAIETARLDTQLAGSARIEVGDTPVHAEAEAALVATLIRQADAIIAAEQEQFEAERRLISDALTEITLQVELTESQIEAQARRIRSYDEQLAGSIDLNERGLLAGTALADLRRRVADEETDMLRLRTDLAATRRFRLGLMREDLNLGYRRMQTWREALAESSLRTAQLEADRAGVLDRIALLRAWSEHFTDAAAEVQLTYFVRRGGPDATGAAIELSATDAVLPGDVVIVRAALEDLPQMEPIQ
ncbi:polysaccharide biosynthesis/export family protein [Jannaschia marina]|uniref:polysaccharide biosynthesis/export family protein n=1 Tax=Jannaschia marina TaxID=2741674 RepID=UPI0015CC3136|nr:polysaccharide biosynthesis/export family protein [Jannaschia marina]